LPGGDQAIVEIEKLRGYCLDPIHVRGRHKARVFLSALGLSAADAETLRAALLGAARTNDAVAGKSDRHGTRYTVDVQVEHRGRKASVRSHWIIRRNETAPRLVSCYVL
jgi:hypothetical protein